MIKGSIFYRDGIEYQALVDGIEHVAKNKFYCIRPKGETKAVTIKQALRNGLIRKNVPGPNYDLFNAPAKKDLENGKEKYVVETPSRPGITTTEKIGYRKNNLYFMPVDQLRAQVFLAHGLIYPAVYDKAGLSANFDDALSLSPADLTMFESPQLLKKNQVLLKVLLNPDEILEAGSEGDIIHVTVPIPISRLVGIEIPIGNASVDRYVDGWVKPDVPVPRHLFSIAKDPSWTNENDDGRRIPRTSAKADPYLANSITKFDRYMGIMAFLRNASRYFSDKTGFYTDYPDEFFSVCQCILGRSSVTRSDLPTPAPLILALLDFDVRTTPTIDAILTLVRSQEPYIEKEKVRELARVIYTETGKKTTLAQAFKTLLNGDYRSAIQVFQRFECSAEAAIFAALYKFSGRQSNGYRTVKQRLHEDWSSQTQAQLVLAALGAYYGYTALDAAETTLYSVHSIFNFLKDERVDIKFHLTSNFERQLIETLYQRAFLSKEKEYQNIELFGESVPNFKIKRPSLPRPLVSDTTYYVQDLLVRQYEVTPAGRIIDLLKTWRRDTIDEESEVGKYLISQCFFWAGEYELSKKFGKKKLHYRIEKSKVIDLIVDGKIEFNPRILEFAIKEDIKAYAK